MVVQFLALLGAGIGTSVLLDKWAGHEFPIMLVLTLFGSLVSYIYSAPPLKLKQSGWIGNYALGSSYIALPWWAGQVRINKLSASTAARPISSICSEIEKQRQTLVHGQENPCNS